MNVSASKITNVIASPISVSKGPTYTKMPKTLTKKENKTKQNKKTKKRNTKNKNKNKTKQNRANILNVYLKIGSVKMCIAIDDGKCIFSY